MKRAEMIGDLFDSPWKILIVAVVLIVLFGGKKLPDAARSLGKSMRILKTEVQDLHGDDEKAEAAPAITAQPAQPAQPTQAQVDALQQQLRDLQAKADAAPGAPVETPRTQAS
ncbi:MAG TPA: Sec-independent protein translocase subunit TatA [Streptosporangiaceae bacterium]|nr:Sec-independent protein translocase subunit TatA [Streptosporangiaceae bacterium]